MDVSAEMLVRYVEHRKRDLKDCAAFLSSHEFQKLEKIGHKLKGNGAMFGYPELSEIGFRLEQAAQAHDLIQLEHSIEEFSGWVNQAH